MKKIKLQKSDLYMLAVILIWALNLSIVKLALREISPIPYNGIRLLCASLVLVIWLVKTEKDIKIKKEHILKIVLLGISGYTVYQYLFIEGLSLSTASNTAVLFGMSPIMISLFSIFFKHERIKPIAWIGILLGFTGVYLTISSKSGGLHFDMAHLKGDLLIFIAVLLWAHYSVSARPLLKYYSPLKFTAYTMTIGSILFFPVSVYDIIKLDYSAISWSSWLYLVLSGTIGLSVALIIWFYSVKVVGSSQTAVYANFQPIFSVISAWLILSESLPASLLLGTVIITTGVIFTHMGREIISDPSK